MSYLRRRCHQYQGPENPTLSAVISRSDTILNNITKYSSRTHKGKLSALKLDWADLKHWTRVYRIKGTYTAGALVRAIAVTVPARLSSASLCRGPVSVILPQANVLADALLLRGNSLYLS